MSVVRTLFPAGRAVAWVMEPVVLDHDILPITLAHEPADQDSGIIGTGQAVLVGAGDADVRTQAQAVGGVQVLPGQWIGERGGRAGILSRSGRTRSASRSNEGCLCDTAVRRTCPARNSGCCPILVPESHQRGRCGTINQQRRCIQLAAGVKYRTAMGSFPVSAGSSWRLIAWKLGTTDWAAVCAAAAGERGRQQGSSKQRGGLRPCTQAVTVRGVRWSFTAFARMPRRHRRRGPIGAGDGAPSTV